MPTLGIAGGSFSCRAERGAHLLFIHCHPALCTKVHAFRNTLERVEDLHIILVVSMALAIINFLRSEGINPCQLEGLLMSSCD